MNDDLQTALYDFQRYLLDQIPPLTASDAVETLMTQPPELLVKQIHAWTVDQSRMQEASQSDFLFHALRKVYVFSLLKLVDRGELDAYMDRVVPLTLEVCPPDERENLRTSVAGMRSSMVLGGSTSTAVNVSRETPKSSSAGSSGVRGAVTDAVTRTARRLSMVVERLAGRPPSAPVAPVMPGEPPPQPAAQLVSMAAQSATSEEELQAYVKKLRAYTGEADPEQLLHVLAANVPRWEIAVPLEQQGSSIEAMHKIITLTSSSVESGKRFRELMLEAVEQFNQGALGPAVSMLELAARVIVEKKLDPATVERVRATAVESISSERLKKYTESKNRHPLLRKALSFFPTLTMPSLFQQLRGEERPERRRSFLSLIEAYGGDARAAALQELEAELNRPPNEIDTYYLRNVVYLLHRIARDTDEGTDKELELLTRATSRGQNIYVIKEAVIPLGHLRSEAAAKVLTMRLAELEAMLIRKDISLYPLDEMQKVLDRIVSALGRIATPAALLTIARHGMKPNPALGDTRARLAPLAQHDLSFDEQTVDILLKAVRDDLPTRIFGRIITTRNPPPLRIIEALASTRSEKVEALLNEVAETFADHEMGRAAKAALYNLTNAAAQPATRQATAATLTGDLDFFGLPSLLQSLADQQATGIVTLTSRRGTTAGKLLFVNGKFADAQAAHLRGTAAVYQLLECPIAGTFAFVPHPSESAKPRNELLDVMPLLFEGIRRHDEYRQLLLFVPDDVTLHATSVKPTADPEESDAAVVRDVWVKAASGTRLGDWETQIAADGYRVRRLVARWMDEGALQPAV
ncbi:MAG TPA: DUF4388 domain-containing protein [Thermoanaerobaculia bacterium]|nr:DUF4388 domain-containing protein [Thermoanaerobaculia bacterium]